jgi:hypothetical protein
MIGIFQAKPESRPARCTDHRMHVPNRRRGDLIKIVWPDSIGGVVINSGEVRSGQDRGDDQENTT